MNSEKWLEDWAKDKFTSAGQYKPRRFGEIYGNTDWALARALHTAMLKEFKSLLEQRDELLSALEAITELYDSDEDCRSLPQYKAAIAAMGKVKGETKR